MNRESLAQRKNLFIFVCIANKLKYNNVFINKIVNMRHDIYIYIYIYMCVCVYGYWAQELIIYIYIYIGPRAQSEDVKSSEEE